MISVFLRLADSGISISNYSSPCFWIYCFILQGTFEIWCNTFEFFKPKFGIHCIGCQMDLWIKAVHNSFYSVIGTRKLGLDKGWDLLKKRRLPDLQSKNILLLFYLSNSIYATPRKLLMLVVVSFQEVSLCRKVS